ncbi:hypothetical protein HDU84_005143 [Entophlyctis sp. JEL0112]|nr:hypothetical protein HDU84_005143 [Entophlyctis sp. JEL0112]
MLAAASPAAPASAASRHPHPHAHAQPGANNSSNSNSTSFNIDCQFQTAALAVTNLFRSAQAAKLAAYEDGYAACVEDLLLALSVSLSDHPPEPVSASAMTSPTQTTPHAAVSRAILSTLSSFLTAKQDLLPPASAESLHNVIAAIADANSPQRLDPNISPPPPTFTFTATPAPIGPADVFHKSHPATSSSRHSHAFKSPSTAGWPGGAGALSRRSSTRSGGGFGRHSALPFGGGSATDSFSWFSSDNSISDLSIFSGDFSFLGLGSASTTRASAPSQASTARVDAPALSAVENITGVTEPSKTDDDDEPSNLLSDACRTGQLPPASSPVATATITVSPCDESAISTNGAVDTNTMKRRWDNACNDNVMDHDDADVLRRVRWRPDVNMEDE